MPTSLADQLKDRSAPDLAKIFNVAAEKLGQPTVKKFENHATALRRTQTVVSLINPEKRSEIFVEALGVFEEPEVVVEEPEVVVESVPVPAQNSPFKENRRPVKFSKLEQDLLDLVPSNGSRVSSSELLDKYYEAEGAPPLNGRAIIIGRLSDIAGKAVYADLPWRIRKTDRSGPIPQSFWLEKL